VLLDTLTLSRIGPAVAGYDAESLGTRPRTGSAFREQRYLLDSRKRKRVWDGKIEGGGIFETARSLRDSSHFRQWTIAAR
jgi:hypothetical protein